ncbi:retrotransposon protein, putative, ty1-copia subclass [Tanacetum coccineum]|uniref:Retrotransposon protein, putative, ty1-copia subclass n=1 Tax=Tanacetum coccineum TaxID=301880 RepID=A0ABQ5EVE9_9ASTR
MWKYDDGVEVQDYGETWQRNYISLSACCMGLAGGDGVCCYGSIGYVTVGVMVGTCVGCGGELLESRRVPGVVPVGGRAWFVKERTVSDRQMRENVITVFEWLGKIIKIGFSFDENSWVVIPPFSPKPKNTPTPKKDNPAKDAICHQCGEVGHWKRNCPIYLSELMKKKKLSQGAITSGIFTIELYSFPSTSWVYDTGCGTHIYITTQGLRGSRKLKLRALSLYMGNGHHAAVEAIGDFHLCIPNGLVLILHNCHYAPSITRGIISVSRLYKDGFVNRFEDDNSIYVFKNNMIYFNAIPRDDIYEIGMSSPNTNEFSVDPFLTDLT